ncbi:MAG: MFS transporter [Candidatus Promineifilaceae bacterium]|nr:MFS transporter [Candidatus Promineifilaceae bacterium]
MSTTSESESDALLKPKSTRSQHDVRWLALLVLGLGLLVGVVDSTVVNVTTPAMQDQFGATDSQMVLLVTVYGMVFASFLLLFGKIGHVVGLRRLQSLGVGLFGLSSIAIGLAPSVQFATGMRIFAGIAAAMIGATGLALLHNIFTGKDRFLAFGLWGAIASLGIAIGPTLGGLAVTYFTWRLAFFINVPICVFIIIGCYLWIDEVRHGHKEKIDYIGAAIIGVGIFTILLGLVFGREWGWWAARTNLNILGISPTPWLLVLGIILIFIVFPRWLRRQEARGNEPIFDLRLLAVGSYRNGMLAAFARQIAQFIPNYALALYLERTAGWQASMAGRAFIMSSIGTLIAAPLSGWLAKRWGTKPIVILGTIIMSASILWLLLIVNVNVQLAMLRLPIFLFGISIGLAASQLNTVIMADVPLHRAGDASSSKSAISRVGDAFGAALVGVFLALSLDYIMLVCFFFAVIAMLLAFGLPNIKGGGGLDRSPSRGAVEGPSSHLPASTRHRS